MAGAVEACLGYFLGKKKPPRRVDKGEGADTIEKRRKNLSKTKLIITNRDTQFMIIIRY
jgi:hypothetical protein